MKYNLKSLFEYLDGKFDAVDNRLAELIGQFSNLQTTVDRIAKNHNDFRQELAAQNYRSDRLEKWKNKIKEATNET